MNTVWHVHIAKC